MSICEILKEAKTVAVVGISSNPSRMSRMIANYLTVAGYSVVGINPGKPKIEGIKVYANLTEVPFKIDIVNIFRKAEDIPQVIPSVLEINPKVLWLQLGIRNDDAVKPCIDRGIHTIQDMCIKVEHSRCL